jgi:hypothetical protein
MLVGRARLTNALDDPAYAQPQDHRAAHIAASATGTGWERTPWHATQRAAGDALKNLSCTQSRRPIAPLGCVALCTTPKSLAGDEMR